MDNLLAVAAWIVVIVVAVPLIWSELKEDVPPAIERMDDRIIRFLAWFPYTYKRFTNWITGRQIHPEEVERARLTNELEQELNEMQRLQGKLKNRQKR